jgi:hypothetical protein
MHRVFRPGQSILYESLSRSDSECKMLQEVQSGNSTRLCQLLLFQSVVLPLQKLADQLIARLAGSRSYAIA